MRSQDDGSHSHSRSRECEGDTTHSNGLVYYASGNECRASRRNDGGCVQQLAVHTNVQMLRVTEEVTQLLERETDAAAMSAVAMAEVKLRDAMELMQHELKAQLDQNLTELRHHE